MPEENQTFIFIIYFLLQAASADFPVRILTNTINVNALLQPYLFNANYLYTIGKLENNISKANKFCNVIWTFPSMLTL